jgi:hypothetical protein
MKKNIIHAIVLSLILSSIIFSLGIFGNMYLDSIKINRINAVYSETILMSRSYLLERQLSDFDASYECVALERQFWHLQKTVTDFTDDLSLYKKRGVFFEGDFNFWKRRHILLQVQLLNLLNYLNARCDSEIVPVLFFFVDGSELSITQALILQQLEKEYPISLFYFDIDFNQEPVLLYIKELYSITEPIILFPDRSFPVVTYRRQLLDHIENMS